MGDVGRLAEPLRLARRRRLSRLGLPRRRFRLLGLVVMPLAAALLALAWAAGGAASRRGSELSNVFLAFHVGLVLAAFAGFTLAAGLAALYLWQERRLKRRDAAASSPARSRRWSARPADGAHDRVRPARAHRSALAIGLARLSARRRRLRCAHGRRRSRPGSSTRASSLLRFEAGWRGRRTAYLALAGFALVVVVRLGLPR